MGNDKINPYKSLKYITYFVCFIFLIEKYDSKYIDAQRTSSQNEITKRAAEIQRSKTILKLNEAVLQQRGHILRAQEELNDMRRSLSEIRERFFELSE